MLEQLRKLVGEDHVWINEPMKNHTTFRAGGCADYLVEPKSVDAVREIVRLCCQENMPYYVVGNGSNLLVSDKGYHGVILHLYKNMSDFEISGNHLKAKSFTGSMAVNSGVEHADAARAEKAVLKELADLCDGPITDEELEDCRRSLLSGMTGLEDTLGGIETWYYMEVLRGGPIQSPDEARAALCAVTKEV